MHAKRALCEYIYIIIYIHVYRLKKKKNEKICLYF